MRLPEHHFLAEALGHRLRLAAAAGLFSADRLDDGTLLLLQNLPVSTPRSILDLGCGCGGLGLPIASARPGARLLLVDRDLLAVRYAERNAREHKLPNVACTGSLGYRDVGTGRFDWILCNVPARIGRDAIAAFAAQGVARLEPGGELRFVVIRDLGPVVAEVVTSLGLAGTRAAEGARHEVWAFGPGPGVAGPQDDDDGTYVRDRVEVGGLALDRPADISEDPGHLKGGLPLLLSCLPAKPGPRALVWRGGYGAAALTLSTRGAKVVAADRDLLGLAFTRRNAPAAETLGAATLDEINDEPFDLVAAEVQPAFGDRGAVVEWDRLAALAKPGGAAISLGPARVVQGALRTGGAAAGHTLLASHGGWAVVRLKVPQARR